MIKPVLHRILIKPDPVSESDEVIRRAKQAGLHVELDKREQAAVEVGTVVSVGSTAFLEFHTTADSEGVVPGAKVLFAKYAGKTVKSDGEEFTILNDEDIVEVL